MSDEQKCPLCDQANRCAMAENESVSACWCTSIRLTEDMLEEVPAKDRGVRCVCATCARALATASLNQALQPTLSRRNGKEIGAYSGRNQSITNRQRWPVRTTGDRTPAEVPDGGLTRSRIEQNVIGFPVAVDVGGASQHPAQR